MNHFDILTKTSILHSLRVKDFSRPRKRWVCHSQCCFLPTKSHHFFFVDFPEAFPISRPLCVVAIYEYSVWVKKLSTNKWQFDHPLCIFVESDSVQVHTCFSLMDWVVSIPFSMPSFCSNSCICRDNHLILY